MSNLLLYLIMNYFDDIQFVAADVIPDYREKFDRKNPGRFSLEFIRSGRMYFGMDHGKRVIFSRPTAYWMHSDHSYQYGPAGDEGYEHYYVTFCGPRGQRLLEEGLQQLDPRGYMVIQQAEPLACLFRELVQLIRHHLPEGHNRAVLLLEEILQMLTEKSKTYNVPEHHLSAIEITAKLIRTRPYENYDIKALAKTACLSASHFRKLFRQYVGTAIGDYLLVCRMRKAAAELEQTDKTAQQIAYETGYDDPAQFSKMFKKKIGLAPREYRKSIRRSS